MAASLQATATITKSTAASAAIIMASNFEWQKSHRARISRQRRPKVYGKSRPSRGPLDIIGGNLCCRLQQQQRQQQRQKQRQHLLEVTTE